MKFKINRKELAEILKSIMPAVYGGNISATLSGVLITADDKGVRFTANNLTQQMTIKSITAEIESEGATVVNAKRFNAIVSNAIGGLCAIELDISNKLKVDCGTAKIKLNAIPAEQYMPMEIEKAKNSCYIKTEILQNILKATAYAVSIEKAKETLTGVKLEILHDKITAVATDARRLAVSSSDKVVGADEEINILLPVTTVNMISSLQEKDTILEVDEFKKHLTITNGNKVICSKLINGTFPNWKGIVPQTTEHCVTLDSAEFVNKLQMLSSLCADVTPVKLKFESGKITLSIAEAESGTGEEEIVTALDIANFIEFNFNWKFLLQSIKSAGCVTFEFTFNPTPSPVVLRFSDESYSVIMPIRKKGN